MEKLISILLLILISNTTYSQILCPDAIHYGMSASTEYSGSGHGANFTLNMVVINDSKSMEFGVIYKREGSNVKGANFKYKSFVGRYNYYYGNTLIKPYMVYNCLYQSEYVFQPVILETQTETIVIPDEKGGFVSTLEHYVGTGVMFSFLNNLYFDANVAVGVYLGSLDKTKAPNKLGFHNENHGFTTNFKIGIGYILR